MSTITIERSGKIQIPAEIIEFMRLKEGETSMTFLQIDEDRVVLVKKKGECSLCDRPPYRLYPVHDKFICNTCLLELDEK